MLDINTCIQYFSQARKRNKGNHFKMEKVKLFLFTGGMIFYIENHKNPLKTIRNNK